MRHSYTFQGTDCRCKKANHWVRGDPEMQQSDQWHRVHRSFSRLLHIPARGFSSSETHRNIYTAIRHQIPYAIRTGILQGAPRFVSSYIALEQLYSTDPGHAVLQIKYVLLHSSRCPWHFLFP